MAAQQRLEADADLAPLDPRSLSLVRWADEMARARKFLAFRIQLNETNVVTAGIPGPHVVSTIISSVVREPGRTTPSGHPMLERELELDVGGLVTADEQYVSWVRAALKVGDRITVDVIETSTVDEPARRPPP